MVCKTTIQRFDSAPRLQNLVMFMAMQRKKLYMKDTTLWYLVGLITSDGCLSSDGRHIDITANDREYLETIKKKANLSCKVGIKNKEKINLSHRLQISNIDFYEFLLSCGLSPKKSLILKDIKVPREHFPDFCRGVIDGDGNIRRWIHPSNQGEQWVLRIYSGSKDFVIWLQKSIEQSFGALGRVHKEEHLGKHDTYILKYGKIAAVKILKTCYYKKAMALTRKAKLAQECCSSRIGWCKSKTTFESGRVAEQVYARDLKSLDRKVMRVQFPPRPPSKIKNGPVAQLVRAHL